MNEENLVIDKDQTILFFNNQTIFYSKLVSIILSLVNQEFNFKISVKEIWTYVFLYIKSSFFLLKLLLELNCNLITIKGEHKGSTNLLLKVEDLHGNSDDSFAKKAADFPPLLSTLSIESHLSVFLLINSAKQSLLILPLTKTPTWKRKEKKLCMFFPFFTQNIQSRSYS